MLKATHEDKDGGVKELKWQWYRSEDHLQRHDGYYCSVLITTDGLRYFIDTHPGLAEADR